MLGKAELPKEIKEGANYHISCEGAIVSSSLNDNEDGTWNKVYTFKPIKVELLDPLGETLKLKDPRKNSQKIRNYLFKIYSDEGFVEPFDDVYDQFTNEVMCMTPQLLRGAIIRINKK
jgi:hypothetical protein